MTMRMMGRDEIDLLGWVAAEMATEMPYNEINTQRMDPVQLQQPAQNPQAAAAHGGRDRTWTRRARATLGRGAACD